MEEVENFVESGGDDEFIPETQPVIVVGKEEFITSGLTADELRQKVPEVYCQLRENFIDLGRYLTEIKVKSLYKLWKYSTFKEYVQNAIAFDYSKANALCRVWMHFGKQPEILDKFRVVGWYKMESILNVVNQENAEYWLSKAKMISADDLKKEVRTYLKSLVPDDPKDAIENEDKVQDTVVADQLKSITYHFQYENYMTVCTAIEKLQKENPGISPPEALSLICGEYLGNAGDGTGLEQALGTIKTLEKFQPIECLVVERDTDHVTYGQRVFQRLIGSAMGHLNA